MKLYKIFNGKPVKLGGASIESIANSDKIEETMTATRAYSAGEYIYVKASDAFYMVTAPISAGNALSVGSNINKVSVGDQLTQLNNIKTDVSGITHRSKTMAPGESWLIDGYADANRIHLILVTFHLRTDRGAYIIFGGNPYNSGQYPTILTLQEANSFKIDIPTTGGDVTVINTNSTYTKFVQDISFTSYG